MQKKTLPSWASSTPPSRDQCVLRYVLRHQAETRPNDVFVVFENGAEWTYAQACEEAGRAGAWLRALGVAKRGSCPLMAAYGPGRAARLVWSELDRRRLCSDQPRIQGRPA